MKKRAMILMAAFCLAGALGLSGCGALVGAVGSAGKQVLEKAEKDSDAADVLKKLLPDGKDQDAAEEKAADSGEKEKSGSSPMGIGKKSASVSETTAAAKEEGLAEESSAEEAAEAETADSSADGIPAEETVFDPEGTGSGGAPGSVPAQIPLFASVTNYYSGYVGQTIPVYSNMVMASSVKAEQGQDHSPYLAFDGNPVTSWQDGGNREIGEFVEVDFGAPQTFDGLLIYSGNFRSDYWFWANNAPTRLMMTADDQQCEISLGSDFCPKYVAFNQPVTARRIRFTITDYRSGSKYRDTVIADILFLRNF